MAEPPGPSVAERGHRVTTVAMAWIGSPIDAGLRCGLSETESITDYA